MPYTRPKTVVCANCGKAFPINPIGRVPRHRKPSGLLREDQALEAIG